jgi:hypothetical protein
MGPNRSRYNGFLRLSGAALLIGGILASLGWLLLFAVFDPQQARTESPLWAIGNFLVIFGGLFMLMGLPGFTLAQSEQSGWFGLLAFFVLFIGLAIPYIAVQSIETASTPAVPARIMWFISIGAPSLFVGALLMGILIITAGVFSKWLGIALIVSVLLGLLTRLVPMPPVLYRALIPIVFTATMASAGWLLMQFRR